MSRRRALVALVVGVVALGAACGVDVPDDVAADIRSSTTTSVDVPVSTETPTSDDELEQALIDNGYTLDESVCGAANLREQLDDDEVQTIVDADTIEDISADTARQFAEALRPCVEDGADPGSEGSGRGGSGGPGGAEGEADPPPGAMPGFGDESDGDVSRSRFLAALISSGLGDEEARCVVDGVFSELDQDEVNVLFRAESEDDVPADLRAAFMDITEGCS